MEAFRALQFFTTCGKLKTLKRTGWVDNDVRLPESVADHMYRMSMMCFALQDSSLNKDRLIKICLCHDLAEAIVGDITPTEVSGVSKEDKRKLEEEALESIVQDLDDNGVLGNEIRELWFEYEERTTNEAKVASQLDKFEMIVQADEYEKQHAGDKKCLESFFSYTEGYFTHPEIGAWDKALREARKQRWAASAVEM
jgi:putative hydrolases of HD superfamily